MAARTKEMQNRVVGYYVSNNSILYNRDLNTPATIKQIFKKKKCRGDIIARALDAPFWWFKGSKPARDKIF